MKDLEEHVAKMAEACGCLYRGDKRNGPPTKLKWWCALDSLEEIREIPSFNIFIMANNLYQMNKNDPLGKVDMVGLVCGSWWNDWIVPDAPGGFDFSKPCQSHDDCYGKCGSKKADCDGKFLEDMRSVCANQPEVVDGWCTEYIGNNMAIQRRCKKYPRKKCLEYAELYHLAVDKYGQGAFDNAQKEGKSED